MGRERGGGHNGTLHITGHNQRGKTWRGRLDLAGTASRRRDREVGGESQSNEGNGPIVVASALWHQCCGISVVVASVQVGEEGKGKAWVHVCVYAYVHVCMYACLRHMHALYRGK